MSPFSHCRVVAVQRLCTRENYDAIIHMKKSGMKIVYDLDDNLWSVPTYNPAHRIFRQMESGFRFCAVECDVITVSTEPLRIAVFKALSKNKHTKKMPPIEVINNSMDFTWMSPVPEEYRKKREGKVVIGWAGTNTHLGDVGRVFNLIPKILERVENLYFEFVGLPPPDVLKNHPRVRQRDFVPIAEFPLRWASWQWDASIAPLDDNKFNDSKSNIKMLEAAAMSIPCLVSSSSPAYESFCKHSQLLVRHCLCDSTNDWEKKLVAIASDYGLREVVGKEMRVVGEKFNAEIVSKKWHSLFSGLV